MQTVPLIGKKKATNIRKVIMTASVGLGALLLAIEVIKNH